MNFVTDPSSAPCDEDGYPTDEALAAILCAPVSSGPDAMKLLDDVVTLWRPPGSVTREPGAVILSTGGCISNRSVIAAVRCNHSFWRFVWRSARQGDQHQFYI